MSPTAKWRVAGSELIAREHFSQALRDLQRALQRFRIDLQAVADLPRRTVTVSLLDILTSRRTEVLIELPIAARSVEQILARSLDRLVMLRSASEQYWRDRAIEIHPVEF